MRRLIDENVSLLCEAIVLQAVEDYKDLIDRGKERCHRRGEVAYSRKEIEEFLLSDWGNKIIRGIPKIRMMSGRAILNKIKSNN